MKTGFDTREVLIHCDQHGKQMGVQICFGGKWRDTTCPTCDLEQTEQHKQRDMQALAEKMLEDRKQAMCVPGRYQGETLQTYRITEQGQRGDLQRDALDVCRGIVNDWPEVRDAGESFLLAGVAGTGKTHLACAVMHGVADRDRRCTLRYAAWPDVVAEAKATYSNRESRVTAEDVVEKYARVDLLVLDELGVKAGSEHDHDLLFRLVRQRYDDKLPTVYCTNLPPNRMKEALGERIYDRLCEGALVAFDWQSYRRIAKGVSK